MKFEAGSSRLLVVALIVGIATGCGRTDIFGSATRKVLITPAAQTVGTGQTFQFAAAANPPEPGDTFQWSVVTAAGGTISSTGLYTAPTGMPGENTTNFPVVVKATVINKALSNLTFSAEARVTVVPVPNPSGITLQKISGDNQMGTVGEPLAQPLVVKAVGLDGTGVAGLPITFDSPLGPTGSATVPTGLDGTAQAVVSAGPPAGEQSFIVSTPGVQAVSFTALISTGPLFQIFAEDPAPSGVVGSTLTTPLTLVFADKFGNPLKGRTAVAVPAPGGMATPLVAASDQYGMQTWQIQLGPAPGMQPFTFTDSVDTTVSTTFTFTATQRVPAAVQLVSGGNQTCTVDGAVSAPIVIQVTDAGGIPVVGVPISWSTPDGGTFVTVATVTNAMGEAEATITCGPKTGFQRFVADAGDIANSPLTVLVQATPGPAAALVLQGGEGQTTGAGAPFGAAFAVRAVDAFSNPVSGVPVQFSVVNGGGGISPPAAVTGPDGLAQANMTAGSQGGPQVYQAAASGLMNSPITLTLTATTPITMHMTIVSGDGQMGMVGTALPQPLVVEVTKGGVPQQGVTVIFGVALGGGAIGPINAVTDMVGLASATAVLGSQPGPERFAASLAGADNSPVFFNETAAGQVIAGLQIISGSGQSAPTNAQLPQPLVVQAIDANGKPIPNATITFTPPAGAQVTNATATTDMNGEASTQAFLGSTAGDELFLASAGNVSVTFRETAEMVIEVLSIVSGNNQTAIDGTMLPAPLVVQVTDNHGNPLAGVPITWAAQAPMASVSQAMVLTDATGQAQVTATLGQPVGMQTFTATAPGAMSSPATFTETATPAPPSQLFIISGNNQSGLVNAALQNPLVVKVADALGNGVGGITVTFTPGNGGGSVSAMSVVTGADGTASVTATLGAMAGPDTFIVNAGMLSGSPATFTETATTAMVTGLSISPTTSLINVGGSVTYSAVAIFSDGTTQVVTAQAMWSSSNPMVASVSNQMGTQGIAIAISGGMTTIQAAYAGFSASASLSVKGMTTLQSILITPTTASLNVGTTLQFTATGTFSDGSTSDVTQTADWQSTNPMFATVNDTQGSKGLASGVAVGMTTITVTLNGVMATATINVIQSNLNNLQITPQNVSSPTGTTIDFHATATYANGTVQDVTSQVQWTSSNPMMLNIANAPDPGVAQLLVAGTVTITANLNGQLATETVRITSPTLMSLEVTPRNPDIGVNDVIQLAVTGTYSDGSTYDLTTSAVWGTDDATVGQVSNSPGSQGLVTGVGAGQTQITATVSGMQASANLTVDNATPVIMAIFNGMPMLPPPTSVSCIAGQTIQLSADTVEQGGGGGLPFGGRIQDVTQDATWSSSDTSIAVVGQGPQQGGLVQCLAAGNITINASYKGQSASIQLNVTAPMLTQITIQPASLTLALNDSRQLQAVGTYSDGSTQVLTTYVTWTSSNQTVATVSNATGEQGTVLAMTAGTTTITASYQGVTGTAMVTVTNTTLSQIIVSPANTSIPQNSRRVQFNATALYSDSSTADITATCAWGSSDPSVATIANGTNAGRVRIQGTGTTQISCTYDNMTGSTSLTVF